VLSADEHTVVRQAMELLRTVFAIKAEGMDALFPPPPPRLVKGKHDWE